MWVWGLIPCLLSVNLVFETFAEVQKLTRKTKVFFTKHQFLSYSAEVSIFILKYFSQHPKRLPVLVTTLEVRLT